MLVSCSSGTGRAELTSGNSCANRGGQRKASTKRFGNYNMNKGPAVPPSSQVKNAISLLLQALSAVGLRHPTLSNSVKPGSSDSVKPGPSDSVKPGPSDSVKPGSSNSVKPCSGESKGAYVHPPLPNLMPILLLPPNITINGSDVNFLPFKHDPQIAFTNNKARSGSMIVSTLISREKDLHGKRKFPETSTVVVSAYPINQEPGNNQRSLIFRNIDGAGCLQEIHTSNANKVAETEARNSSDDEIRSKVPRTDRTEKYLIASNVATNMEWANSSQEICKSVVTTQDNAQNASSTDGEIQPKVPRTQERAVDYSLPAGNVMGNKAQLPVINNLKPNPPPSIISEPNNKKELPEKKKEPSLLPRWVEDELARTETYWKKCRGSETCTETICNCVFEEPEIITID